MSQNDEKKLLPTEWGSTDGGFAVNPEAPYGCQVVQAPPVTMKKFESEFNVEANDYFGWGLFTLICCSCPIGLIALLKTAEVRRYNKAGQYDLAWKSSKAARFFVRFGIITGLLWLFFAPLYLFTSNIGTILHLILPTENGTNATMSDY